jgi:hypothetical protein
MTRRSASYRQRLGRTNSEPPVAATTAFFCLTSTKILDASEKRARKPDFCNGWKTKRREGTAYDRSFSQHNARAADVPVPSCPAGARTTVARTFEVYARRSALIPGRPLLVGRVPARIEVDLTRRPEWRLDACGPGRQASPPRRSASGPAASTPGNGEGAHEVTARDHPAPGPAGLPLRQGPAARQPSPRRLVRPRGLTSFTHGQCRPPWAAACRRRPGGGRT